MDGVGVHFFRLLKVVAGGLYLDSLIFTFLNKEEEELGRLDFAFFSSLAGGNGEGEGEEEEKDDPTSCFSSSYEIFVREMERLFHSLLDILVASAEMVPKAIGSSFFPFI